MVQSTSGDYLANFNMLNMNIVVVLLSIGIALGYHIQDTPEDLKEFFQNIDKQIKILEHETMIQIRENVIPLGQYVADARAAIIDDIISAAVPYWSKIKSLEDDAAQQGQNISECISLGNNQLYILNNTLVSTARVQFDYYEKAGNDILTFSSTEAYSVIEELLSLGQVVAVCNDDTCATELKKTVTQYFARAKATLIDAETKARNYVLVYLPVLLAANALDSNAYVANYTVFLNDVTDCIDQSAVI